MMYRILVIVLIFFWIILIGISAVNVYNQYQVSQQSLRVIKAYKLKTEVNPIFSNVHDSLNREIAQAESLSRALIKPFPIKSLYWNWLILRLAMIIMTIVTGILLWLHYKRDFIK